MTTFERDRISIRYPDDWTAETADDPESGGWTVTVTSPQTAFFMMSLQPDAERQRRPFRPDAGNNEERIPGV